MCFSAGASFGSSAILALIGVASIRKTSHPAHFPFSTYPFIFSFQQLSEGFVWLSLNNPSYFAWQNFPVYTFLTFSHVVWPVWIPLSILLLEKDLIRRKVLKLLLTAGISLSLYHVYCLLFLTVNTRIDGLHIQYFIAHPANLLMIANIFYVLSTILPFLISSINRMWWLGVYVIISYLAAFILFKVYVISVWCYFATMLSVFIYMILCRLRKNILFKKDPKSAFRHDFGLIFRKHVD